MIIASTLREVLIFLRFLFKKFNVGNFVRLTNSENLLLIEFLIKYPPKIEPLQSDSALRFKILFNISYIQFGCSIYTPPNRVAFAF